MKSNHHQSPLYHPRWAARPPALENPVLHPWHLKGITLGGGRFLAAFWNLKIANIATNLGRWGKS